MKPPKKGFFKGVLGSRLGLSLFRSDSVLASWPALSAQSPEILFRLDAVLSPAGDCVWLGYCHVAFIFAWAGLMLKFWKNPAGPCGAPTYLPTYLPYLWETKKEITRWVKVGYYTN